MASTQRSPTSSLKTWSLTPSDLKGKKAELEERLAASQPVQTPELKITAKPGKSFYKQIKGIKYDKAILEMADSMMTGTGDGRISKDDAGILWNGAEDGTGVTECERRTLQYVMDNYNCTDAGRAALAGKLVQEEGGDEGAMDTELEEPEAKRARKEEAEVASTERLPADAKAAV